MKSFKIFHLLFAALSFLTFISSEAQVKITDGASVTMDANSILELESSNKGFLPPRVIINSLTSVSPLTGTVPAGMLVYSSGGSVTDGYYLWDGSKWKPFLTGTGGVNLVVKTADATLTKNETLVAASNDITLTLPVVTSADDGLTISIKNNGTYMDVVTVSGASELVHIDGSHTSLLYKNWGRTYIAVNGNWIRKENTGRTDNSFDVSAKSSWTSIEQVIEFLGEHMTGPSVVQIGGGTYPITSTQTINLPFPVTFIGLSFGETIIEATNEVTGSPLFICETECYFKMLTFNAVSNVAGNDAIHLTGSDEYYEVKDAYFVGFNRGVVITTNNESWFLDIDFEDCAGAGIEISAGAASGGLFKISEADFIKCSKGISLFSGVSETVSVMNCGFYNSSGGSDIAILYNPAGFTAFEGIDILSCSWNNQGTFISGFDFTRSDGRDADINIENNIGIGDQNPHCNIAVKNNALQTTCTTADTWYKMNWANTSSATTKLLINDNHITYLPSNPKSITFFISGNVLVNSNNRNITIGLVKNGATGTRYGETTLRLTTANQPFQFSTVIHLEDIVKDDFFEFYCSSANSGDIAIFQDINIFVDSK